MEQQDRSQGFKNLNISPETEFWAHCSNLQAWFENDYDTRLLHRILAFPLLKKLTELGAPIAKKVFKEEIIHRLEEGNFTVARYLYKEGYLDNFSIEEIGLLSHSIKTPTVKLILYGIQNDAPQFFIDNIDKLIENIELANWLLLNSPPFGYPYDANIFDNFDQLKENPKLAKWAILNRVDNMFYDKFDKLKESPELAKWGVHNKAPHEFYTKFSTINENPSNINALSVSSEFKEKILKRISI